MKGPREQVEELVDGGTWLDGFDAARLRQADGCVVDYVMIDPKLNPKKKRVWLFFFKSAKYTSAEFDQHIEQQRIADWRFRLAQ